MKMTIILRRLPLKFAIVATAMALTVTSAIAQTGALTTVHLSAQRMSKTLPDGTIVPMWGLLFR